MRSVGNIARLETKSESIKAKIEFISSNMPDNPSNQNTIVAQNYGTCP